MMICICQLQLFWQRKKHYLNIQIIAGQMQLTIKKIPNVMTKGWLLLLICPKPICFSFHAVI